MTCHGWGTCAGVSSSNALLFPLSPQWSDGAIAAHLRDFVVKHPRDLGLAPGIKPPDLGLSPAAAFRQVAGALTLFRFEQRYRGLPIFGPDGLVTMVANSKGAVAIRGMIIDGRHEYLYVDEQADADAAHASIVAHAFDVFGAPPDDLLVDSLALVAVPRFASLGWAATVTRGSSHLGTLVVSADPASTELLPLLSASTDTVGSLVDATPVALRTEDLDSNVFADPIETLDVATLRDGSPLLGSLTDDLYQLATTRLVGFDASTEMSLNTELVPLSDPVALFSSSPDDPRFDTQRAYHLISNFYAFTDLFMEGRWESTLPFFSNMTKESLFEPSTFEPRAMVFTRTPSACGVNPACVKRAPVSKPEPSAPYRHPLDHVGSYYEDLGFIAFDNEMSRAPTIAHEFGHFVDLFAKPGFFHSGLACTLNQLGECEPSCDEDTTDEAPALAETWAQLAAIWYLRSLSAVGGDPTGCALLDAVDLGSNQSPHNDTCRLMGQPFSLLLRDDDPECPDPERCDKPDDPGYYQDKDGIFHPTGLCSESPGYRTGSYFQAFWELLHAQECATTAPFTCTPLPGLANLIPEIAIGEAMLYAVRVSTGTYRGFVDDVATYVSCNFGPDVYAEVNGVLCHHELRDCGAPPPLTCQSCRNGVREGNEACDLNDLGGASCQSLGFDGGTLACTLACTIDTIDCFNDPETDTDTGTSIGATGDTSATTGGAPDPGGCGCMSTPSPGAAAPPLLALAWLRRRPRTPSRDRLVRTALVPLVLAIASACTGDSSATTSESSGTSTAGSTSSTSSPDPRFFGVFHDQSVPVGFSNEDLPDDVVILHDWKVLTISQDGRVRAEVEYCHGLLAVLEYTWAFDPETGSLELLPTKDGLIEGYLQSYTKVSIAVEPECGHLTVVYTRADDGADVPVAYYPGRVCAEVTDPDKCRFHIVWCDEGEGPACPEPLP